MLKEVKEKIHLKLLIWSKTALSLTRYGYFIKIFENTIEYDVLIKGIVSFTKVS